MASSKSHRIVCPTLAVIMILGYCAGAWGIEFAGGKGTPSDPYQIATAEQLLAIGTEPGLSVKYYVLVADIDLAGPVRTGPVIPSLAGDLDGNGLTIRNLRIKGYGRQGLIGYLVGGALVKNLGVEDVDVIGTGPCGALAADSGGDVLNCYSTGVVTCAGSYVGGLIGQHNYGTISNSYSTVEVMGYSNVGGLVGKNNSTVSNCHSAGPVTGSWTVGGLVGDNSGEITLCYSSSDVTGGNELGGLAGRSGPYRISFCYSTGHVAGAGIGDMGGLVGYNTGEIVSSYSIATVTGQPGRIGGLVGTSSGGSIAKIKSCYFLSPADGGGPDNKIGTALPIASMRLRSSYAGWDFWGTDADGVTDPWFVPPDACPVLAWQTDVTGLTAIPSVAGLPLDQAQAALTASGFVPGDLSYDYNRAVPSGAVMRTYPSPFALPGGTVHLFVSLGDAYDWATNPGDGTAANPYQILSAGQLESLGDHPELWDKHFVLAADVDMIGRMYATALIAPDVNDRESGFQGVAFTGGLDGNGHAILNLQIFSLNPSGDYLGLFGMIDKAGQVNSLTLQDVSVIGGSGSGSTYVGALAGYNGGTLVDCSATGVVSAGCDYVSDLVGSNRGSVVNCYADVSVTKRGCPKR